MTEIDQRRSDNQYKNFEYLTSKEAASFLDVKLPTLYAYTSRGLVRSVASAKGRARLYLRTDLERLRARRDARAGHGPVAAAALRFGEPVLDTHLTAIDPVQGPVYRAHLAFDLAEQGASFERVSELLWTGTLPSEPVTWFARDMGIALSTVCDPDREVVGSGPAACGPRPRPLWDAHGGRVASGSYPHASHGRRACSRF